MRAVRSTLESSDSPVRGSAQLARVAYAGALTGIVAMTMAFVTLAAASSEGANANPVVSRAVTTASAGPFLVAAVGFAAFLMSAGLLTLRTGVLARWTGIVALIGATAFLVTLLTVISATGGGSAFGYAFFPAILSLVTRTIATSIATSARWRRCPQRHPPSHSTCATEAATSRLLPSAVAVAQTVSTSATASGSFEDSRLQFVRVLRRLR